MTAGEEAQLRSNNRMLGAGLLLSASLYRPLVMWAENAWDLSDPERLMAFGLIVFALSLVPYLLLVRAGVSALAAGTGLAGVVHVGLNWHLLEPSPLLWLMVVLVVAAASQLWLSSEVSRWIAVVVVAMLVVAPLVQLGVAHVQKRNPYPVIERPALIAGERSGEIEDVVIVIVDSYPSLEVAATWFSHDTNSVRVPLEDSGFTVLPVGWSQHTFTGLAVPSLLELGPVVEPGPKGRWGNRLSLYQITRGDNLVALSLHDAGYRYTHIESGWDGGSCGPVDVCIHSPVLDETVWELLRPSIGANFLADRYGYHTVASSLNVVEELESMARRLGDGEPDYIFAHLLLPHSPLVVDARCEVTVGATSGFAPGSGQGPDSTTRVREQLECVDRLITRIAELTGPGTAMIITGDHGTATNGQLSIQPGEWSSGDIAERLGVFLAYKLPATCSEPASNVNTDVMRAIVACALEGELPPRNPSFMLGADEPVEIPADEVERIEQLLRDGAFTP